MRPFNLTSHMDLAEIIDELSGVVVVKYLQWRSEVFCREDYQLRSGIKKNLSLKLS